MKTGSRALHDRRRMFAGVRTAVVVCGVIGAVLAADHALFEGPRYHVRTPNSAVTSPAAARLPAFATATSPVAVSLPAFAMAADPVRESATARIVDSGPPERSQAF